MHKGKVSLRVLPSKYGRVKLNCRLSSVDKWSPIYSLLSICIDLCHVENTKINIKEAGIGPFAFTTEEAPATFWLRSVK